MHNAHPILSVMFKRLPDINKQHQMLDHSLSNYGRFAVLRSETFWFGDIRSSHPTTTQTGWYWAIDKRNNLVVSARGSNLDLEKLLENEKRVLRILIAELEDRRLLPRYSEFRIADD